MEPRILYKFMKAEHLTRNLQDRQFKVTAPRELNDPFEFQFSFREVTAADWEQRFRSDRERERLLSLLATTYRDKDQSELEELFDHRVPDSARQFEEFMPDLEESLVNFAQTAGFVLSLCAAETHPLLWSHYADSYQGVAIGRRFDAVHPAFKVTYSDSAPVLDPRTVEDDPLQSFRQMALHKSRVWECESEYRIVYPQDWATKVDDIHVIAFEPQDIVSVTLGARFAGDTREIRRVLDCEDLRHVELRKARALPKEYRVTVDPAT